MCEWACVFIFAEQMWRLDAAPVQYRGDNVCKVDVGLARLLFLRNAAFRSLVIAADGSP